MSLYTNLYGHKLYSLNKFFATVSLNIQDISKLICYYCSTKQEKMTKNNDLTNKLKTVLHERKRSLVCRLASAINSYKIFSLLLKGLFWTASLRQPFIFMYTMSLPRFVLYHIFETLLMVRFCSVMWKGWCIQL